MNHLKKLFFLLPLVALIFAFTTSVQADPVVTFKLLNRTIVDEGETYQVDLVAEVPAGGSWSVNAVTFIINFNPLALDLEGFGGDYVNYSIYSPSLPASYDPYQIIWADGMMAVSFATTSSTYTVFTPGQTTMGVLKFNILNPALMDNLSFNLDEMFSGMVLNGDNIIDVCEDANGSDCWWYNNPTPQIINPPACVPPAVPTGMATTNVGTTTATIGWNTAANVTWQYRIGEGTPVDVTTNTVDLADLTPNTEYNWQVRALNIDDPTCMSDWCAVQSFTTNPAGAPPAAPVIVGPTGCGHSIYTATLTWNASAGATGYEVQVNGGSIIDVENNLQYFLDWVFNNNQTVNWQVRAYNAFGTSDWSAAEFTTMLATPANLTPNGLVFVGPTNVLMDWDDVPGATGYILHWRYVGLVGWTDVPVTASQYVGNFDYNMGVEWHVHALNDCNTSLESETATFTTHLATPICLAPTGTGIPQTTNLVWSEVNGATHYIVWFSDDPTFATYTEYNVSGTTQEVTGLLTNHTYYFKVQAWNLLGNHGEWSAPLNFTTTLVLGQVTLNTPANAATNVPMDVILTWLPVANATQYQYQVGTDANLNSPFYDEVVNVLTSMPMDFWYFGETVYWRVRAINGTTYGPWSEIWSLTTVNMPAPILLTPANESTVTTLTPTLTWQPGSPFGVDVLYQVDLYQGEDFIESWDGLTATSLVIPNNMLEWQTEYNWKVLAYQEGYDEEWSATWTFTTPNIPAPNLLTPANATAFNQGTDIAFAWSAVSAVTGYSIVIAADEDFEDVLYTNETGVTNYTLPGMIGETYSLAPGEYYWRVCAVNNGTQGAWSASRMFEVVTTAPLTVTFTNNINTIFCSNAFTIYFGDPNLLITNANGSGNYSYTWTSPDGEITGLNNANIKNPTLSRAPNSAPFPVQNFTLNVHDNVSGQNAQATFQLNLPSSPVVVLVNPAFVRKQRSAPAINLNTKIVSINGSADLTPYTLNWSSPNDLGFGTNGSCITPCVPNANPNMNGLIRYDLIASNTCESQVAMFYIFSYGTARGAIFELPDNDLVYGSNSMMAAWPIPAESDINVQAAFASEQPSTIKVMDIMGNVVLTQQVSSTDFVDVQIDLRTLASGTYMVVLQSETDKLVKKFIKY